MKNDKNQTKKKLKSVNFNKKFKSFRTLVKCLSTQAKNTGKRRKNYTNFFWLAIVVYSVYSLYLIHKELNELKENRLQATTEIFQLKRLQPIIFIVKNRRLFGRIFAISSARLLIFVMFSTSFACY